MCIDIGLGFPEHPNIHYTYLAHLGVLNLDSHQLGTGGSLEEEVIAMIEAHLQL